MTLAVPEEVLAAWEGKAGLSHWDGPGGWAEEVLTRAQFGYDLGNVLEWGSGGGVVAVKLAALSGQYFGVDIHPDTRARTLERTKPVCAASHVFSPEQVPGIGARSMNTIISTAVFQHFHSHAYAEEVLAEMHRLAAPGAKGLIQTRYGASPPEGGPYCDRMVGATAWHVEDFWGLLAKHGFEPVGVELQTEPRYAWYRFVAK